MNLQKLLDKVREIGKEAGEIGLSYFSHSKEFHVEKKGGEEESKHFGSPVTEADLAVENFLKERLLSLLPGSAFLGEESGRSEAYDQAQYHWIVDPIDGTRDFSRGMPEWAVIIALQYKGEVVLGFSYLPVIDEMVYAMKGGGAWCNGEKIQVTPRKLSESFICHERHKYFMRDGNYEALLEVCEKADYYKSDRTRSYHYLAQGKTDAAISPLNYMYEIAPYMLIIQEAGGKVSQLTGEKITEEYTNALFTNGACHDEIVEIFSKDR